MAMRICHQADMVTRADRLPVIKNALLGELVPAFAGAQRSAATAKRAWFATELHASVLPAIRSVVQSAEPSGPVSPDLRARLTELEVELRRIARRQTEHPPRRVRLGRSDRRPRRRQRSTVTASPSNCR